MTEINKYINNYNYKAINIRMDEGEFDITFAPNLDLYWNCKPNKHILKNPNIIAFKVTKENYYLYECFDNLYKAIKDEKPFENSPNFVEENKDLDEEYIYKSSNKDLLINDVITWHSDEDAYDESSVLHIKKNNENFDVMFERSKRKDSSDTFWIRFRNSGSRYDPYNITFMYMYHKLLDYDYQMHMEEIIYNQEKTKKLVKENV